MLIMAVSSVEPMHGIDLRPQGSGVGDLGLRWPAPRNPNPQAFNLEPGKAGSLESLKPHNPTTLNRRSVVLHNSSYIRSVTRTPQVPL